MRTSLKYQNGRQGIALIIVLAMLVLLSGLLVAFLSTSTIERNSSYAYSSSATARQIADSTVSFAIGHIRDATSSPDEDTTWASQPGAIRTFSGRLSGSTKPLRDGATYDGYNPGAKDSVYKLYSADRMKVTAQDYANTELPKEVEIIEKWNREDPDIEYADVNEPLVIARRDINPDGTIVEPRYPIVDPRAALSKSEGPSSAGSPSLVEGFDAKIDTDKNLKLPSGSPLPYLPMPVKWLYVLSDGTMGPSTLASENNPIVGRTAFWTDDETCKLNINTASEGTFWDTPSASSMQECGNYGRTAGTDIAASTNGLNLAASQPVRGEYQRYPGHPATTCLSPALGFLFDLTPTTPVYPYAGASKNLPYWKFKNAMYEVLPFVPIGKWTSQAGMRNTDLEYAGYPNPIPTGELDIKTKHLYATVDELIFKSQRFNGTTAEINSSLTPEGLEKARFFLTASSRAPELNLYSRPRVTIWPINADYRYRTSFDDLFIFASTVAKNARGGKDKGFYFLREDAKSSTVDFTGNYKSGSDDQNQRMYTYLQWLTERNVPGYGSTFNSKWGGEGRDLMLTMMFDYIRAVNINDTGASTRQGNIFAPYTPRFYTRDAPADQYQRYDRSVDWSGQVVPLRRNINDKYQGLGRFVIPSEIAVIFHKTTDTGPNPGPRGSTYMRATMAFEMSTVMPGFPALRETYWTRVVPNPAFLDPATGGSIRPAKIRFVVDGENRDVEIDLCGDPGRLARGLINIPNVASHEVAQGRGFMPGLGFMTAWYYMTEHNGPTLMQPPHLPDPMRKNAIETPRPKIFGNYQAESFIDTYQRGKTVTYYPYTSKSIPIPKSIKDEREASSFSILELGAYRLEIYAGEAPDDKRSEQGQGKPTPVQIIDFEFPRAETPSFTVPTTADISTRLPVQNESTPSQFIQANDVVRSLEFTGGKTDNTAGDLRMGAALAEIPSNYYAPVREVATQTPITAYTSTSRVIHRLTRGHGDPDIDYKGGTTNGRLAAQQNLRPSKPPILPMYVTGVQRSDGGIGDFDRGLSKHTDGAFGNKVDEGNLKFDPTKSDYTGMPYYRGRGVEETGQTFFSPNRQLCSAVMFGSLPTGVTRNQPWQTLLFRPNRESKAHPGSQGLPDHLILDLFHMPVVEPYAISEPFSTMGKVNMNYVMAPFGYAKGESGNNPETQNARSYIRRDTALRGVMKSTFIMAVPSGQAESGHIENPQSQTLNFRFPINMNRTIEEMETRMKKEDEQYPLFRSASEITTIDLYPTGGLAAPSNWDTFWNSQYGMTGDNMRERPYAHIFPRLTTKSNVYTVHMRCQSIRQGKRTAGKNGQPASYEFNPELDPVVAEYRGSATIERFIDPNDAALASYDERTMKVDPLYRYRIVNTKHFTPR